MKRHVNKIKFVNQIKKRIAVTQICYEDSPIFLDVNRRCIKML